jgi:hypothetical protein
MPYLKDEERRQTIWDGADRPANAAELNYLISMHYLKRCGSPLQHGADFRDLVQGFIEDYIVTKGLSYQTLNDIVGVLGCVQGEMINRAAYQHLLTGVLKDRLSTLFIDVINPYEITKRAENGDIIL